MKTDDRLKHTVCLALTSLPEGWPEPGTPPSGAPSAPLPCTSSDPGLPRGKHGSDKPSLRGTEGGPQSESPSELLGKRPVWLTEKTVIFAGHSLHAGGQG